MDNTTMKTFEQSLLQLPVKKQGDKYYIYDWVYYFNSRYARNLVTHERFIGSWEEFIIEKNIWNEELLI